MPIKVVDLHHHAVAAGSTPEKLAATRSFYSDLLGLRDDDGRPEFGISGNWYYTGKRGRAQVHIVGVDPMPQGGPEDPPNPLETHLALGVEDLDDARRTLEEEGCTFIFLPGDRGVGNDQIFLRDPMGHMIELHEAGQCRCNAEELPREQVGSDPGDSRAE